MAADRNAIARLRSLWDAPLAHPGTSDYRLLGELGAAYPARTRNGNAALLVPLGVLAPGAVGLSASGCQLVGHAATDFELGDRKWSAPAAVLVCTDHELIDAFAVLAAELNAQVTSSTPTWQSIVSFVGEWQALLAPRGHQGSEFEIGLWGELWFIAQSSNIGTALASWRGPEHDVVDFFLDSVGAEVKTSRKGRQHHISRSQVDRPVGEGESWLLSLWVKADPIGGTTLCSLADAILEHAPDRGLALAAFSRAGYAPADRVHYKSAFAVLAEPEWYSTSVVPRVRQADRGVTDLRYRITLDPTTRAASDVEGRLWHHFHGHSYRST